MRFKLGSMLLRVCARASALILKLIFPNIWSEGNRYHRELLFYIGLRRLSQYRSQVEAVYPIPSCRDALAEWTLRQLNVKVLNKRHSSSTRIRIARKRYPDVDNSYCFESDTQKLTNEYFYTISQLYEESVGRAVSPERIAIYITKFHGPQRFLCLVRHRNSIVGFMTAYIDKGQPAYIEELVIAPEHQGLGLGRHMLSLLFHELAHRRVCRVGLAVLIANYQAQHFYEKNGFHYVAVGHCEFLMEKRLRFCLSFSRGFAPYKPYMTHKSFMPPSTLT